jgi:hypothetical protein
LRQCFDGPEHWYDEDFQAWFLDEQLRHHADQEAKQGEQNPSHEQNPKYVGKRW